MLTVGTDTYSTVAGADAYIAAHYRNSSADRQRWGNLGEEDKEICLRNACLEIESLRLIGLKYDHSQPLAFPRRPYALIPVAVTAAQAELALWLSDETARTKEGRRRQLQAQGVQSFSIGDLSESYSTEHAEQPAALMCPAAKRFLSVWTDGGFAVC